MAGIILFNPRAAATKPRIPNSIMHIAASIDGLYEYELVDGNMEKDPIFKIVSLVGEEKISVLGITVMPGPQLKQAVAVSKKVRALFPSVKIVWGGYFPSNHPAAVLESGYVDVIVNGMGDKCFPMLLDAFQNNSSFENIPNLVYKKNGQIVKSAKDSIYDPDQLPRLPYTKLNGFYPIKRYLGKTYLGTQTIAYHSSFGCPFTCSFCGIVPIYNARWKGRSAKNIFEDIKYIRENFGGDAIEFHDNNFFVSEKRTVEFAKLITGEKMRWWGEARIDTMDKFSDESLQTIADSGCKMIFFGAETGNDEALKQMDKGGTQTGAQVLRFAERIRKFNIIPEYSFVLGMPGDSEEEVWRRINEDIEFIKQVKQLNPEAEIIIYVYSPVANEESALNRQIGKMGFAFPKTLDEWVSPAWEKFDLRKNPLTPWLKPYMIDRIKSFETVLNGYYPTVSDIRLSALQRKFMKLYSSPRYKNNVYKFPLGIKVLQKVWRYRQPEIEGF